MKKRSWGDLSPGTRKLILGAAVFDVILRLLALRDLAGRNNAELSGSKLRWGIGLITISSSGVLPLIYFFKGRRRALSITEA